MVRKIALPMVGVLFAAFLLLPLQADAQCCQKGWIQLFDGYSLDGWKKSEENPDSFKLQSGSIVANGPRAHIFYVGDVMDHNFKNFELKVDVKTKKNSNGGIFIHTEYQEKGWPSKGYEVQVNNSYKKDHRKTGSLYNTDDVTEQYVDDDKWFTEHIVVLGDHVTIYIEDKKFGNKIKVVDYIEPADKDGLSSGTFALQAHDPGSTIHYSNIRVRPLNDLPEWVTIFNGKNYDGWEQINGRAEYTVEDGVAIGKTVKGSPNSFMCTKKDYANFELEYQTKVDPRLNAGVQIRSNSFDHYKNGRVHGYQVELDPSDRAWSAGIYDEARRGWLFPLAGMDKARNAFTNNEWNTFRILCMGDRIRTWINGVPAADLVDGMTKSGFIGLQVHGFRGDTPATVMWKNIRVRDLSTYKCCANCPLKK